MVFEAVNTEVCPYLWKQTLDTIKIYVPISSSSTTTTATTATAVATISTTETQITSNHLYAKLLTDDDEQQQPLIDMDLITEILPDESTWTIKFNHIVFTLKKRKSNEFLPFIFNEPISIENITTTTTTTENADNAENIEHENLFVLSEMRAPLTREHELISSTIWSDILEAKIRFQTLKSNYVATSTIMDEGEPSQSIMQQFNVEYMSSSSSFSTASDDENDDENHMDTKTDDDESNSEVKSDEELAQNLYTFATMRVTDLSERLKLYSKAAKLGHVKAKLQCIRIYEELIRLEKLRQEQEQQQRQQLSPMGGDDDDEQEQLGEHDEGDQSDRENDDNDAGNRVIQELEDKCFDYVRSVVFLTEKTSLATSAFIKLATYHQMRMQYQEAFDLYVIAALNGSAILMEIVGSLYVDDILGADRTKRLAWYQLGLDRGSANCAQLIAFEHLMTENYQMSYNYFKVANFIDPSKTIVPDVLLGLQKMRDSRAAEEESSAEEETPLDETMDMGERLGAYNGSEDDDELFEKALNMVDREQYQDEAAITADNQSPEEDEQIAHVDKVEEELVESQLQEQKSAKNPFLFDDHFEDEEEEEEVVPVHDDKPGIGWKISEYALTAASVLGIGFFIYKSQN